MNMLKTSFYVCHVCGNVISSTSETIVSCHGITLLPLETIECNEKHNVNLEKNRKPIFHFPRSSNE